MKIDAVFEGGGVKGLAYLGAIEVMEKAGYTWERLAGTSAGSLVASLLAVGYDAEDLKNIIVDFPFEEFETKTSIGKVPIIGPWLSLSFHSGIYKMTAVEAWLTKLLRAKGKITFGDLPENKLKIIVADISRNRMSILPDDSPQYGIEPKTFPIARAVLMSSAIPFFVIPRKLQGNLIVDGGLLSNYPIWIFDVEGEPKWPTIGFRLSGPSFVPQSLRLIGPVKTTLAIVRTMLEAHDKRYIDSHSASRTVFIKNIKVGSTDFTLSKQERMYLIHLGKESTLDFLRNWNFRQYVRQYRSDNVNSNIAR